MQSPYNSAFFSSVTVSVLIDSHSQQSTPFQCGQWLLCCLCCFLSLRWQPQQHSSSTLSTSIAICRSIKGEAPTLRWKHARLAETDVPQGKYMETMELFAWRSIYLYHKLRRWYSLKQLPISKSKTSSKVWKPLVTSNCIIVMISPQQHFPVNRSSLAIWLLHLWNNGNLYQGT